MYTRMSAILQTQQNKNQFDMIDIHLLSSFFPSLLTDGMKPKLDKPDLLWTLFLGESS